MSKHNLGRILVVDDETELMAALCESLNAHGYDVVGFPSGKEALAALAEQGSDLLLTDLMMPEMDGISLLRQALEIDPHLIGIMMTGQGTVQTAVEAMKIGAFDYVLKPFRLAAMLPVLDRAMEVRRLRMENVQLRETVAIYDLCTAISYTLDLNTLLNKTIDAVLQQLSADEASIMLPTGDGSELYVAAVRGEQRQRILGTRVPLEQGIAGWVARHQEPVTLLGEVNDPRFVPVVPRADIGYAVSMPMLVGGKLVGVLNVNLKRRRSPLALGQIKALSILAGAAGAALDSALLFSQVRQAEDKYRSIIENSSEGIFQINPEGRFITANPALARMLGYSSPADLMAAVTDISHQVFVVPQRRAEYGRLMEEYGHVAGFEFQAKRQDGIIVWLSENAHAVRSAQGALLYYEGAIEDLTERKRAEEEVQSRAQELELLYGLSRALAESNDLDQVLDIVNRYTVENINVTFARIALLEGSDLVMRAAYPIRYLDHDLFVGDQKPVTALPYCQRVLEGHELVILHASDPEVGRDERTALLLDYVHSLCLVPLRVGETGTNSGHVLGILMLGEARNEGREPITPQKLHLIRSVGDQAASAIRRMLLRQETERRLQHLSALIEIDRAITSGFDLNISIETLLAQVIKQLEVDAADVLLLNSTSQTLEFFCGQGFRTKAIEGARLRLGESYAGRAALERIFVHVSNLQDPSNGFLRNHLADENFVTYYGAPLIAKGQVKGVLEIFNRAPFEPDDEWLGFLKALAEQAAIAIDNAMLFDSLTRSNIELSLAYNDTIEGWSHALDLRDKETEGHTLRVTENTLLLARSFGLGKDELVQIRWGALLHDIGKMGVPDNILLKPGPLTDEEWVLMKKHPSLAYELLSPITYLRLALDIPYCHHEKWDGTGYPRGLKGEQIPLAARFFAVVDVWDALRSDRPYRAAWPDEKVLAYIQSLAGSHFDPQVVKVFLESEVLVGKSPGTSGG